MWFKQVLTVPPVHLVLFTQLRKNGTTVLFPLRWGTQFWFIQSNSSDKEKSDFNIFIPANSRWILHSDLYIIFLKQTIHSSLPSKKRKKSAIDLGKVKSALTLLLAKWHLYPQVPYGLHNLINHSINILITNLRLKCILNSGFS